MANKKNEVKKQNVSKTVVSKVKKKTQKKAAETNAKNNAIIMKVLVFLGVIVSCIAVVYLMNYFFVEKSYIKINMSTDKKLEYITLNGKEELISTQKYVSDLKYTMRYDVDNFMVFKYKSQDIYKFLNNEKVLVVVEESGLPSTCEAGNLDMTYNNCYVKIDNYTEEYYVSTNGKTYRITVKTPNNVQVDVGVKTRIDYMLNSFEMSI